MSELRLYLSNLVIALARVPKTILGLYKYSTEDGYFFSLLVTLDLLVNTILAGDPDETVSSRSGKAMVYEQQSLTIIGSDGKVVSTKPATWGWGCRLCSFLATFQENHCGKAVERNKGSRAVVPDESP